MVKYNNIFIKSAHRNILGKTLRGQAIVEWNTLTNGNCSNIKIRILPAGDKSNPQVKWLHHDTLSRMAIDRSDDDNVEMIDTMVIKSEIVCHKYLRAIIVIAGYCRILESMF